VNVSQIIAVVTDLGGSVTLEAGKLKARVPADRPDLLETLRANRDAVLEHLTTAEPTRNIPGSFGENRRDPHPKGGLERLPHELEALIWAAQGGALPTSLKLEAGVVPDANRYALAWGCSYLIGAGADALPRLWAVWRVWRVELDSRLN
jgi:hypothetical protein